MKWKRLQTEENIDLDDLVLNIVSEDMAEEGLGKAIVFGTLAFLLGSANIVEGAEFSKNMERLVKDKQVQQGKVTITQKELKDVIEKSKARQKSVGEWQEIQVRNILARTLYSEARGEGKSGMDMVMTVIWNRADGKTSHMAEECLRQKQFSCWNGTEGGKTPSTYSIQFPKGATKGAGKDFQMWNVASNLVESVFNGSFKPIDPHWNAYYNPDKASPRWASQLVGAKNVGHHTVGELKDVTRRTANRRKAEEKQQVAASKEKANTYTVKDGDTLYAIAGKDMKKVAKIKELNGLKSDSIRPGQVLKVI